jgi:hypothetical protein
MVVVGAGAVHLFVHLLSSPSEDNVDQAVWAIGNLAGDPSLGTLIFESGVLPTLLRLTDVSVEVNPCMFKCLSSDHR